MFFKKFGCFWTVTETVAKRDLEGSFFVTCMFLYIMFGSAAEFSASKERQLSSHTLTLSLVKSEGGGGGGGPCSVDRDGTI
jgi:hypothetical protein